MTFPLEKSGIVLFCYFVHHLPKFQNMHPRLHCTQPPLAEVTKLLCPHHEGAGAPHPFRVGGPDLWYQMTLVDTTVERSLVSSAGGARR